MITDDVLIKQIQYAIQAIDDLNPNVRKMHAVTALRAITQASFGDALDWVERRMQHFIKRQEAPFSRAALPYVSSVPRLITSLKDFVDLIDARAMISASYCEGCGRHAPAEPTPDGHGLASLGKLEHRPDCPLLRARRLLDDLGVPQ
jgi:hypothetical protein